MGMLKGASCCLWNGIGKQGKHLQCYAESEERKERLEKYGEAQLTDLLRGKSRPERGVPGGRFIRTKLYSLGEDHSCCITRGRSSACSLRSKLFVWHTCRSKVA